MQVVVPFAQTLTTELHEMFVVSKKKNLRALGESGELREDCSRSRVIKGH
jgi:hypothetical protein